MKANDLLSANERTALAHLVSVMQWANSCTGFGFAPMAYSDQRGLYGHAANGVAEIFKHALNVDYYSGRGPNFGASGSWYEDLIAWADELLANK